jgi:hypothetical protein
MSANENHARIHQGIRVHQTTMSMHAIIDRSMVQNTLRWLQTRNPFPSRDTRIITIVILSLWLATVVFTTTRHEYWRDEVRPWSLVHQAQSPLDLPGLIRDDGHPLLWYLMLYIGKSIADTPLILPIISIGVAFVAVALFLVAAPFPFWMRILFIFSALPFYEYSVMARNYGISMLLLFLVALLYQRRRHPLLLAVALALLANTNVHSLLFAGCITLIWIWDTRPWREYSTLSFILSLAIIATGAAISVAVTFPNRNNILTDFYSVTLQDVLNALMRAIIVPGRSFADILPPLLPTAIGTIILYGAIAGLWRNRSHCLVALVAQLALAMLFQIGYIGRYRHEGLYLVFLLSLYWITLNLADRPATLHPLPLFNIGLYGSISIMLLSNVAHDGIIWVDITKELSSSKALGAFLVQSPIYHDAIIVPEPDYLIESLPYYAPNKIYLPREHQFSPTVHWTTAENDDLTLGQLMADARELQAQYDKPVLIVFSHAKMFSSTSGQVSFSYNKLFTWSIAEYRDAQDSLQVVTSFTTGISDENYVVFALRQSHDQ